MRRTPLVVTIDVPEPVCSAFARWAREHGEAPIALAGSEIAACPTGPVALAVLGADGDAAAPPERIRSIRKALGGAPLVILGSRLSVDTVVTLMRAGVANVIGMPAPAADVVARAYLHARSIDEFGELIGEGDAVARLRRELAAVAPLRSTVLILGETGVGKGLAARLIHELSPHRDRPFVHVDCAALATSVVESELFGHERGAFTGAASPRAGRFELAGEGTIFLDEIGDLDASVQVKLLRVLQDRAFERLGGVTTRVMPARVIAATNRDLRAAVSAGTFRMDLYFRLNVFQVRVPPLRERLCDLPALARAALERIAAQLEVPIPPLSDSFYERLRDREWPGNVRELMNEMERFLIRSQAGLDAVVESDGDETFACLPVGEDRAMLEEVLREAGGNISRAARRLGIARSTLRYRIARSGLDHLIPKD